MTSPGNSPIQPARSDQFADLRAAIDRVTHGSASARDLLFIEQTLADSPEARAFYLDYTLVHTALQWEQGPLKTLAVPEAIAERGTRIVEVDETTPVRTAELPRSPFRNPTWLIAATLLAACGVAIYLLAFNTPTDPQPDPTKPGPSVATLIHNTGDLRTPHGYPAEGDDYGRGEYTLTTGTAEFMLTNAVNVKLRGETRMVMHNNMNVALTRGSAEFVCPKDAKGFTVHLPDKSRIVDLGTAFRVNAGDDERSLVSVTQGSVRIEWSRSDSQRKQLEIAAGEFAQISADGIRGTQVFKARVKSIGVLSIDFNLSDSPATVGDASHADSRLAFSGEHRGAWNTLDMGSKNRVRSNRTLTLDGLTAGSGERTRTRFVFNSNRTYWFGAYDPGHDDGLRDDRLTFSSLTTRGDLTPTEWRIDGLVPGAEYRLILFSSKYQGKAVTNSPDFIVGGSKPDRVDGEGDSEYSVGVRADESGVIHSRVILPADHGDKYFGWSGLQIRGPLLIGDAETQIESTAEDEQTSTQVRPATQTGDGE